MITKTTYIFVIRAKGTFSSGRVSATSETEARRYAAYQAVDKQGRLLSCLPAKTQPSFRFKPTLTNKLKFWTQPIT